MKIAFVISGKSPLTMAGGIGAYAYSAAKAMAMADADRKVFVIAFSARNENIDLGFATLVHFRNPYASLLGIGSILSARLFVRQMETIIERERPDEITVFSAGIWGIAGRRLKQRYAHQPLPVRFLASYFLTYEHEYRGHLQGVSNGDYGPVPHAAFWLLYHFVRWFYTPFERRMLESCDAAVVHYGSSLRILRQAFPGIPADKFAKIPYAVELYGRTAGSRFVLEHSLQAGPVVAVICRQDPRKGIHIFLRAVKRLSAIGAKGRYAVVGDGIFLNRNKRLARRLGLGNTVLFTGFVDSVDAVLAQTDIVVLPSFEEGAGSIGLLEAMQRGKAIVATDCDGIPEDFVHGETALLVPPGDEERLADAIGRLLGDEALRRRIGLNAQASFAEKFSVEQMSTGLRDLLRDVPVRRDNGPGEGCAA